MVLGVAMTLVYHTPPRLPESSVPCPMIAILFGVNRLLPEKFLAQVDILATVKRAPPKTLPDGIHPLISVFYCRDYPTRAFLTQVGT